MFKTKDKEKFEDDFCYGDEKCKTAKRKRMGGICRLGRRDIRRFK